MQETPGHENLYRRRALLSLAEVEFGRPLYREPRAWSALTFGLALAFVTAVVAAAELRWHQALSVRGWLVPSAGVVAIASDRIAMVDALRVAAGDRVQRGQILVELSTDRRLADGRRESEADRLRLDERLDELLMQRDLLAKKSVLDEQRHAAERRRLQQEQTAIAQRLRDHEQRLELGTEKLRRLVEAGSAVAEWQRLEQREALAALQADRQTLQRDVDASRSSIRQLELLYAAGRLDAQLRLSALRAETAEIRRQRSRAAAGAVLAAPRAGIVGDVSVDAGATVGPGQRLMSIIAATTDGSDELTAELLLPSRAAAFAAPGMPLHVELDAYPRQQFGTLGATIEHVAAYVTLPRDAPAAVPITAPAYRSRVRLDATALDLKPGMGLRAELLLESRSLLDWLIGPLRDRRPG